MGRRHGAFSFPLLGAGQDEALESSTGANANATANAQTDNHVPHVGHVVPTEGEIPHNIRDAIIGGALVGHGVFQDVHSNPLLEGCPEVGHPCLQRLRQAGRRRACRSPCAPCGTPWRCPRRRSEPSHPSFRP